MTTKKEQSFHECHVFRHWWKPTTVDESHPDYYVQHMVCMRCEGVRRWKVSRSTGDPMGNNYNMQDGYYNKPEEGQDAAQIRKELRLNEIERNRTRRRSRRGKHLNG